MRKYLEMPFFICLIAILSSCDKTDLSIERQKDTYMSSTLNPLTNQPENLQNFSTVQIDSNQLVFSFNSNELPAYKGGDILFGTSGDGYLRKVLSTSIQGNNLFVQTDPASIDEAFDKVTIDTTFDLTFPIEKKSSDNYEEPFKYTEQIDDLVYTYFSKRTNSSVSADGKTFTKSFNGFKIEIQDYINGGNIAIEIDSLTLELQARIKEFELECDYGLEKFKWLAELNPKIQFKNVSITFSGIISKTDSIKILPEPIPLGVIPTSIGKIVPEFNLFAGLTPLLKLSGGLKSKNTITLSSSINIGGELVGNQIQPVWSADPGGTYELTMDPTGSIEGEVKLFLKLTLDARFNGTLGLGIFAKPYEYNKLSLVPFKGEIGVGIAGGLSANMRVFSKYLFYYDLTLIDKRKPFFTGSFPEFQDNPTPGNNSMDNSPVPELTWNCSDTDGDQMVYDIYFGTSDNPPLVKINQDVNNYTPSLLNPATNYFWRIVARDKTGLSFKSPLWNFTTASNSNLPPVADFIAGSLIIETGSVLHFEDLTANNPDSWLWDFGDGGVSNTQNPEYTYHEAGVYNVSLTVSNSFGSDTELKLNYITVKDAGTGNGILFNPNLAYGSLADTEGNVYKTIIIGEQEWMAENLRSTKYNDNSSIQNITDAGTWSDLSSPAYCWYNNDEASYKTEYGALYNWYVVSTGNICPTGWRVPGTDDWELLRTYLGGKDIADEKLRETGLRHWFETDPEVTNESGFTALPTGLRFPMGGFGELKTFSAWWSSSDVEGTGLFWTILLDLDNFDINGSYNTIGLSIRCIK